MSIHVQAWETFFAHYITGPSKTWYFLLPFYYEMDTPVHLRLAMEAVSLVHFSYHAYSPTALEGAKNIYISALQRTSKALQSPKALWSDATILTALLLDLYEKFTSCGPRHITAWTSHVNGALTLVRLRGLDHFQTPDMIKMLVRISTNNLISCIGSESSVPPGLIQLRSYAGQYLDVRDPKWMLSDIMVEYAQLRSDIRKGLVSLEESIRRSLEVDGQLEHLVLSMPASWQYHTTTREGDSEQLFSAHYDIYPGRHVTQAYNVIRLVRIFLNEHIVEHWWEDSSAEITSSSISNWVSNIETLRNDICASAHQYTDSTIHTRSGTHPRCPSQDQDCYSLIFPLYVAGRSHAAPIAIRQWIISQLYHIRDYFNVRNADVVAKILESGQDLDPWTVYAILGSYAFAA
jgi:hypothetical protein